MPVQAHHLVGGAHHQVQVMGDHQHAAAVAFAQRADQPVQRRLAGDIHTLHRLVEHQQFGLAQQGARQQYALQLAAGDLLQRVVEHVGRADFFQRGPRHGGADARHQAQETLHAERQGGVHLQFLRHVADSQFRSAPDLAAVRLQQAQHDTNQGGLAGAVGANQRDDFARSHAQVHRVQGVLAVEAHADPAQAQQVIAHAASWQRAHRPTTSTVSVSTRKPTLRAPAIIASLMAACSSSMAVRHSRQIRN